jgi:hypothetical protein
VASIWDDPDVREIIQPTAGQPNLMLGDLEGDAQAIVLRFIGFDERVTETAPQTLTLTACLEGIRAFERLPDELPGTNARGWKKFVLYMTAANAQILWNRFEDPHASAVGGWVLEAMESLGIKPDGFATALGSAYSSTMSIHGSATTMDSETGSFVVRGGGDGRALAGIS